MLFRLYTLLLPVYMNRHAHGSLGTRRPKKVGAKKARKEKLKVGLQPAGDS